MAKKWEYTYQGRIRKTGDVMVINVPYYLHKSIIENLQEPYTVTIRLTGMYLIPKDEKTISVNNRIDLID